MQTHPLGSATVCLLPSPGPGHMALLLTLITNQYPQFPNSGPTTPTQPPSSGLAVPKLLEGQRLRSRSVSRDTLLRSTSFLLRNPLSCRTSSSSTGHGAPSSSSCGNSCFQSCPPRGRAPGATCRGPQHSIPHEARGQPARSASPCPVPARLTKAPTYQHHQVSLLPPKVCGRRRENRGRQQEGRHQEGSHRPREI